MYEMNLILVSIHLVQGGAEETHVFHIKITLLILKIDIFHDTKKEGILMHF
jgi:hypothetical protein